MGLNERDDIVLDKEESNQMQPIDLTNYGSREKEIKGVQNNVEEGTSVGIKTIAIQCLDRELEKKDVHSQFPVDATMLDDTIGGREDAAQPKARELKENIHQATTIDDQMEIHNEITVIQGKKDQGEG
ncbi:hypothetical protein K7X08_022705 [Anisodus acutangulus]|uniref:Uncharacterized protein n=1 Tax=Anisodus acutangulus TaxID=402998 RepID=A0A9Q1MI93_9SOLA|nr:hypothetical protein K7X08_022705 [Anisodus acutangulus]